MKPHAIPFMGPSPEICSFEQASVVVLPCGYEGGVSYGRGTAAAPKAVLEASAQVEFYDEDLNVEPVHVGIATVEPSEIPTTGARLTAQLSTWIDDLMEKKKFVVLLGGDHSVTNGYLQALARRYETFGVIALDAHADLRENYEGSPWSHACVMARARELTPHTLQIGIRSLSLEEVRLIKEKKLTLCTMRRFREGGFNLKEALAALPPKVFITIDVDVFDWSVIASTGTPEPGGMRWHEMLGLLESIFSTKEVVGFDVVELAYRDHDVNSPFAVAKLVYKMIGLKYFQKAAHFIFPDSL